MPATATMTPTEEPQLPPSERHYGGMYTEATGRWCFPRDVCDDDDGKHRVTCMAKFAEEATDEEKAEVHMQLCDQRRASEIDFDQDKQEGESTEDLAKRLHARAREYAACILTLMRHKGTLEARLAAASAPPAEANEGDMGASEDIPTK